ncbi:MAG TPA: ABC transporter permease [Candidatus Limnocylindria bacterium]|jgi:peptide/nickel transport system permease protein|nr:ABC transporter permease [Candidatus Limnocylindria bacterium]
MTAVYVLRRTAMLALVVWAAASFNFLVPRLAPGDPVGAILAQITRQGGSVAGSAEIIASYRATFGLDEPLGVQYLRYLAALARFDLGPSLTSFPTPVMEIIGRALPWTIGLLVASTLIAFVVGTILGALMAWRGTPAFARFLLPPLVALAAVPYYLLAIVLVSVLAFGLRIFPSAGTVSVGALPAFDLATAGDVLYHSLLPALSIVLAAIGGWMLGMRALVVSVIGSDFLVLAEAKGLPPRRVFLVYALRNAILPQITGLAISLGTIASGAVLVEVIFSYPGLGYLLLQAIQNADYTLIQGITFVLVLAVGLAIYVLDLLYPVLDPRISYAQR